MKPHFKVVQRSILTISQIITYTMHNYVFKDRKLNSIRTLKTSKWECHQSFFITKNPLLRLYIFLLVNKIPMLTKKIDKHTMCNKKH